MINLRAKEQKNIAFQSFISLKKFKALIKKKSFFNCLRKSKQLCICIKNYLIINLNNK